jgi:hypothetical protein
MRNMKIRPAKTVTAMTEYKLQRCVFLMQIRIKKMQIEILQKIDEKQNAISHNHQYF